MAETGGDGSLDRQVEWAGAAGADGFEWARDAPGYQAGEESIARRPWNFRSHFCLNCANERDCKPKAPGWSVSAPQGSTSKHLARWRVDRTLALNSSGVGP